MQHPGPSRPCAPLVPSSPPPSIPDQPDLPPKCAAAILNLHAETVRCMCRRGDIPGAYRIGRRAWRIPVASLQALRDKQ